MSFPFYMQDDFGLPVGLVLCTVIGFFFGLVLERSGFGRADILVSQFYLDDMRVLKVMFTAIVTAMLGMAALESVGLLDMSQRDGDTPGRMRGQLRHPEGTHVNGNDIDIAYYQTGDDNLGRPVCVNDNYFCTADPILLDDERSAYFIVQLFDSPLTRVIGVDTLIAPRLQAALPGLEDAGLITSTQRSRFNQKLAYGDGWPFHHHHMHLSWSWEDGHERGQAPEGCMVGPGLY